MILNLILDIKIIKLLLLSQVLHNLQLQLIIDKDEALLIHDVDRGIWRSDNNADLCAVVEVIEEVVGSIFSNFVD
jgi:hypothetical protein